MLSGNNNIELIGKSTQILIWVYIILTPVNMGSALIEEAYRNIAESISYNSGI